MSNAMKPAVRVKLNVANSAAAAVATVLVLAFCQPVSARAEQARNFGSSPAGHQTSARGERQEQGLDLPGESQLDSAPSSATTPRKTRLDDVAAPSLASQDGQLEAAKQPSSPHGLILAIREVYGGKGWAKTWKRLTKLERDDLKAFYAADGQKPLWISQDGINDAARALLGEFASAEKFGLRSKSYAVSTDAPTAATPEALARRELELTATALIYARHAKAGRAANRKLGRQLPHKPQALPPRDVLAGLQATADPSQYLRALHPQHPQFVKLQRKLAELRQPQRPGAGPRIPAGPVLKPGMSHPHVALLRQRLGGPTKDQAEGDDNAFDTALAAAVKKFQRENGLSADGIVGSGTRRALNGPSPRKAIAKIILNMERWRWLPDDLAGTAKIYVWSNIPELTVRVVQDGKTVFSEKSIVGQVSHKTPIFSDRMEWIEFHPTWYVPASIKVSDILPSLRRPTSTVMERYNLRVDCGEYGSNWRAINWREIDISKCNFTQPPGKLSVLGDFKFKFPNKHAVYMHDTHDKRLFSQAKRTFSHGCIRIKNPRRLAEILLANDKDMTAEKIGKILAGPKVLHKETFNEPVPVHITYFTALFDEQGKFVTKPDYYGFDRQLDAVLNGRKPARAKRPVATTKKKVSGGQSGWMSGLFNAN